MEAKRGDRTVQTSAGAQPCLPRCHFVLDNPNETVYYQLDLYTETLLTPSLRYFHTILRLKGAAARNKTRLRIS